MASPILLRLRLFSCLFAGSLLVVAFFYFLDVPHKLWLRYELRTHGITVEDTHRGRMITLKGYDETTRREFELLEHLDDGTPLNISIAHPRFHRGAFGQLSRLQNLRSVHIGTLKSVSGIDEALTHLEESRTLVDLSLAWCDVTVKGMQSLGKIKSLKRLTLSLVSDSAISSLKAVPQLKVLSVSGPVNLNHLHGLDQLEVLCLNYMPLKDVDLEPLVSLPNLRSLEIYVGFPGSITDEAFSSLAKMPRLKNVWLLWTKVTPEGVSAFRAQRPGVNVVVQAGIEMTRMGCEIDED